MQFQCPFSCFFNKRQNAHRFINNMYSGSRVQTALSENVVGLTLTVANEILPFSCFARKYHRFDTLPDASQADFWNCAKTEHHHLNMQNTAVQASTIRWYSIFEHIQQNRRSTPRVRTWLVISWLASTTRTRGAPLCDHWRTPRVQISYHEHAAFRD